MNNKKIGNDFERELCEILSDNGFWAYNCPNKVGGQPADIIAAKNKRAFLIDAKECTKDLFDTIRIEENQLNSMKLWKAKGNGNGYFALKFTNGEIMFVTLSDLLTARKKKRVLNWVDVCLIGITIQDFLEGYKKL